MRDTTHKDTNIKITVTQYMIAIMFGADVVAPLIMTLIELFSS